MNVLRRLLARRRLERDLADEIRQHLDEQIDELVAGGVPRDQAVYLARRAFGNPTLVEERAREVWRLPLVDDLWADLRYGLRQWRRSPAFAGSAILTLALGIGASTAVFSVVSALVLTTAAVSGSGSARRRAVHRPQRLHARQPVLSQLLRLPTRVALVRADGELP